MYKFVFPLLISLLSISVFAQKNETKVMYSPVSLGRMVGWDRNLDDFTSNFSGAFMIDYNRYLNPRMKLGVNLTYEQGKAAYTTTDKWLNPHFPWDYIITTRQHSDKESWLFFGPQIGFEYIQKDNFRLGSLVGLSMVLVNRDFVWDSSSRSKGTDISMFFHAELINFTWGKTNGLTGQLGFGHKGLISLGYFIRW